MTAFVTHLDHYRDEPGDEIATMLRAWRMWTQTGSEAARDVALSMADDNRVRAAGEPLRRAIEDLRATTDRHVAELRKPIVRAGLEG